MTALLFVLSLQAHAGIFGGDSQRAGSAGDQEAELARLEAEHVRISDDIEQLAERRLWSGVEKRFQDLSRRGITPSRTDLVHAAMATRNAGDMLMTQDRLRAAEQLDPSKEITALLSAIDNQYALVELIAHNPRETVLAAEEMPFEPDMRTAIESAVAKVQASGSYRGLLPRGAYTFAGQRFEVEPGLTVRIEVSPRLKKTEGERVEVTTMPVPERR